MEQLSLLGGKAGRINAANTDWNFTNVITPLTEQLNIDQMCKMLFDGSVAPSTSTFSSSSVVSSTGMNSLSSCSNDNYYFSEDEWCGTGPYGNREDVSNVPDMGSGNRLYDLKQLENLLTSTVCCKHCVKSSHSKSIESFVACLC